MGNLIINDKDYNIRFKALELFLETQINCALIELLASVEDEAAGFKYEAGRNIDHQIYLNNFFE